MTFDLERARGLRDFLQDDCAEVGDVWAEMIAEIERLRADAEQYTISIEARLDVIDQQAAKIKELESLVESSMSLVGCHQRVIEKQEKALVEERARGNHYGMSYEEATDGNFERWIIDGEKDLPKFYLDRVRAEARRQLQAEGKIGPDAIAAAHNKCSEMVCYNCGKKMEDIPGEKIKGDYLIGEIWLDPGQEESRWDPPIEASYYFECHECAPSWEITEERKAAIKELSELLTAIGCPSCHYYIQKNYGEDITVLRAMLEEADHDKP